MSYPTTRFMGSLAWLVDLEVGVKIEKEDFFLFFFLPNKN